MALYDRVVTQERKDKNKVYSLHEPSVKCISKGKIHKKYEFGNKVSVATVAGSNVVVGMLRLSKNIHDSKTLSSAVNQVKNLSGIKPTRLLLDKGYRGHPRLPDVEIIIPGRKNFENAYAKRKHKKSCKRRSAVEGSISHLKHTTGMLRHYLSGYVGDTLNALLAASGCNLRLFLNELRFVKKKKPAYIT